MSPIIKWRVSSGARSCRSVGYLCKPDYEVTGIFVSLIRKWRVSLWGRSCGSVGYLCKPDSEVTGIFASPIMRWRVSLWSRLWSDGYLCEPDYEMMVIFVSPILKWRVSLWARHYSDWGVCVSLMGLGEVYSNTLFSGEGSLDQVSRCYSHWVRPWGSLWTLEIGVRFEGVKIWLTRLISFGEL